MRRSTFGVAFAAVIAALTLAGPRVARAQQAPAADQSRADSLTAKLIDLELHRTAMSQDELAILTTRIDAIHAQLRALPQGLAADQQATTRLILAFDARADTLGTRLREARNVFTDKHPAVRRILDEYKAITERRAELVGVR